MTALRFQTGGRHQTSPASLQGWIEEAMLNANVFTLTYPSWLAVTNWYWLSGLQSSPWILDRCAAIYCCGELPFCSTHKTCTSVNFYCLQVYCYILLWRISFLFNTLSIHTMLTNFYWLQICCSVTPFSLIQPLFICLTFSMPTLHQDSSAPHLTQELYAFRT